MTYVNRPVSIRKCCREQVSLKFFHIFSKLNLQKYRKASQCPKNQSSEELQMLKPGIKGYLKPGKHYYFERTSKSYPALISARLQASKTKDEGLGS